MMRNMSSTWRIEPISWQLQCSDGWPFGWSCLPTSWYLELRCLVLVFDIPSAPPNSVSFCHIRFSASPYRHSYSDILYVLGWWIYIFVTDPSNLPAEMISLFAQSEQNMNVFCIMPSCLRKKRTNHQIVQRLTGLRVVQSYSKMSTLCIVRVFHSSWKGLISR